MCQTFSSVSSRLDFWAFCYADWWPRRQDSLTSKAFRTASITFQLPPLIYGNWQELCRHDRKPRPVWILMSARRVSVFVQVLPSPRGCWSLTGRCKHKIYFHTEGIIQQELWKFWFTAWALLTTSINKWLKRPLVYEEDWWTGRPVQNRVKEFDLSSLCRQQGTNAAGPTLKCPNGLYGPVTVQAPIKDVSEAWLEQRDPLGLTSAVPGTVGCSSSSPPVFNVSSTHVFLLRVSSGNLTSVVE